MVKISCIMPVYNTAQYLEQCITSILSQSFKDFEFIISDDWSTDWSKDIIKKYEKKDSRIIFINNKKNRWICANLNDCLKVCQWEYIAIMESDDISDKERFRKQYNLLNLDNTCWMVGWKWIVIDEKWNNKFIWDVKTNYNDILSIFFYKTQFITPWITIRKSIFDDYWLKIEWWSIWDSILFNNIILKWIKVSNINSTVIYKRELTNSMLSNNYFKIIIKLLIINIKLLLKYKNINIKYYYQNIAKFFISFSSFLLKKIHIIK